MCGDLEDKYQSEVNKFRDKRDHYRNEVVSSQKEIDQLRQENITLQRRIDELSIKSFAEDKINPDPDSDEEFFRELTPKRVHFFKYSTANIKSPTPASICGIKGSNSCPSKIDTFNGTPGKYE
ncbi:hypothetical protein OnM2_105002 [Erysiphe neolycopersici]|uniref:Uncharacterized protein n=1 Tax=Erysiphe neolycopersici TaxID=212602 RepID=A0A420H7R5_9PEZI|nr:hypothetical protein OnM2_105002 [Erysiphe neolycopersici]